MRRGDKKKGIMRRRQGWRKQSVKSREGGGVVEEGI